MFLELFWEDLFHTFIEFLYAPLIFKDMLWILIPVLLAILLMEIYFYRYPREGIGHHKSLENTIFLLFISIDLIRYVVTQQNVPALKSILVLSYLFGVIVISLMDFFHKLSTSLIFKMSSKSIVTFISYVLIILVYSDMLDSTKPMHLFSVVLSIILLFFVLVLIRKGFSFLEPKSYEELEHFLQNIEEDIKRTTEEIKKGDKESDNEAKANKDKLKRSKKTEEKEE